MAEQYAEPGDHGNDWLVYDSDKPASIEDNVFHIDPRPILSWDEKMRRIGAEVISIKKADDGLTEYSHKPINAINEQDGSVAIYFEKFATGYSANEIGIPHTGGWNGTETRSVVIARFNASTYLVDKHDVHPRNYRYILPGYESRKKSGKADAESDYIKHFLWHNPANNDTQN